MLSTISFAPSPSLIVERAVPKAAGVSCVSESGRPPRHAAMPDAPAGAKVQQVDRVCDVVERGCINEPHDIFRIIPS